MSRLYAWLESDTSMGAVTKGGHQLIAIQVNYGNKYSSKRAVLIRVEWMEGEEKPTVFVYPMEGINIKVCDQY